MIKFKLKSVVVTLVATSALTFGGNAMAATAVWDWANGILIAAQTAMQSYMISLTNSGIDTVASNQAKQSQVQEALVKAQIQHDAHRENAEYIRSVSRGSQEKVVEAAEQTAPSIVGCVQRTEAEAITAVARRRVSYGIANRIVDNRSINVSEIDTWGNKILAHNQDKELCSDLDVLRSVARKNQCVTVGMRADADKRIGSIFYAAGTGETLALNASGKPKDIKKEAPKMSMDEEEADVARKAIENIVTGSKPALLSAEAENTPAGRGYVAMTRVHDARLLVAASALTDIAERRQRPDEAEDAKNGVRSDTNKTGAGPISLAWEKMIGTWFLIDKRRHNSLGLPSKMELLDTIIHSTDTEPYINSLDKASSENLQREQLARTNLNTKVLWMVFQQLERQTSIQAAALAHSIEPITQESMKATREAAMRGKN